MGPAGLASFVGPPAASTRHRRGAVLAELYLDGQLLSYEGGDPVAFREQARARLGLDPADDDRWESARQFWCPARVLDIVLADYGEWPLRQENGLTEDG